LGQSRTVTSYDYSPHLATPDDVDVSGERRPGDEPPPF
jgi:hypothetical protein